MKLSAILPSVLAISFLALNVQAAEMKMAVTTSFHNSGLSDILVPEIKKDLDIDVQLIVVGTGQALKLGRAGDVDALLVHSRKAEEKFVSKGHGTHRREIMYNDFVLIGPSPDPARIAKVKDVVTALRVIKKTKSTFVSRGDDSGTHRKELSLWKKANFGANNFSSDWYRAVGSGMGATLNAASGMNAYLLSDRASWLKFKNKGDLKLLFSGDSILFNQYTYIPVHPSKHVQIKNALAQKLEKWLVSSKAQKIIGAYTIGGEHLFTPNANSD